MSDEMYALGVAVEHEATEEVARALRIVMDRLAQEQQRNGFDAGHELSVAEDALGDYA